MNHYYTQGRSINYKFREAIVEFLKIYLFIIPMQFLFSKRNERKLSELRILPDTSVGKNIANLIDNNDLKLIPFFEEHDLKHLVLNYGMTSTEELKLQAFLLGNGNRSPLCFLFLTTTILFPEEWSNFIGEYKKGKASKSIIYISLDEVKNCEIDDLTRFYSN